MKSDFQKLRDFFKLIKSKFSDETLQTENETERHSPTSSDQADRLNPELDLDEYETLPISEFATISGSDKEKGKQNI